MKTRKSMLSGWGQYPQQLTERLTPHSKRGISEYLAQSSALDDSPSLIARGLGRSYGDSALAEQVMQTEHLNHYMAFNADSGELECAAGVSFAELLAIFVPRGWFLPVTPGTKFVTVGGAIASDVHGKNHHVHGCFSQHVTQLTLALANGEVVTCSPDDKAELFRATCGGMGLTGVILQARFKLIPIESAYIQQRSYKSANLAETLALFEEHDSATYSVAWIDCLSTGDKLGRSLLMLGEHATDGELQAHRDSKLNVPLNMPGLLLNRYSIQAFNTLYYHKHTQTHAQSSLHYEPFFYPLDGIRNWNRLYGKNGFTQYQFVLPKSAGLEGMTCILKTIAESKRGSFLAVLKAFGEANDHYLSFPTEGYTLALDFKIDTTLFSFLEKLDRIVLDYGGRLYLTKDARMSEATFKQSYPEWQAFQEVRHQYGADRIFNSLQSQRLGL
ncbi:MAG: FAD-binding oxidoreductase [Thiomicrorhabdus chilensis]|uniref:FAD-binding oxidoreductase n=1 Tax=Thiomicrorhabdus chilensis TaxID=63656 RepID=UPI00299D2AD9|nr:FAD-binding oxidoreductase [Thiomicrorhabdus chilensis]MDX1346623.1 FAD-binding oxidoreductase [Thiomicrorhabdus chilensis]